MTTENAKAYEKVVVCRHGKNGALQLHASAFVPNKEPALPGTSLWLTDFPGTLTMAHWVAEVVARVVATK